MGSAYHLQPPQMSSVWFVQSKRVPGLSEPQTPFWRIVSSSLDTSGGPQQAVEGLILARYWTFQVGLNGGRSAL